MPLPYENPKWDRARKEVKKIGYCFDAVPTMDGYIKILRESGMGKEDYAHYFACISNCYHSWVRDRYLVDPNDPLLIDDICRFGISGVLAQQLGGLDLPQWENEFARALYALAAIDCTEAAYFTDKKSVLGCMLTEDHKAAERLLSTVEAEDKPRIGSQYIDLKYLKNIYLAVIHRDEAAFRAEMVRRVKNYRRNPYTHTVVIDFPLVALIKIAKRNGISYQEDVAEVPKALLAERPVAATLLKLPLAEEAAEQFGLCCGELWEPK